VQEAANDILQANKTQLFSKALFQEVVVQFVKRILADSSHWRRGGQRFGEARRQDAAAGFPAFARGELLAACTGLQPGPTHRRVGRQQPRGTPVWQTPVGSTGPAL